ncbi:Urea-proton symporter DUR3 [Hypsibius exemplaris]|uniref:Urea-proton symporter DUR3 n=1 Tax=Hypsibius exemplaris TaxID=2072580 RepID=A0A1W0XBV4_HYPEX|nr:Urea-proton symporter DUR3 [Hypsibius exemplaris]
MGGQTSLRLATVLWWTLLCTGNIVGQDDPNTASPPSIKNSSFFAETCLQPFPNDTTCFYKSQQCIDRIFNTSGQGQFNDSSSSSTSPQSGPFLPSTELWQGLLIFLGILAGAVVVAQGSMEIRKRIYNDKDSIETAFEGGGAVSGGLTASVIVAQWTWAATLLQSTNVASRFGVVGSFWYASGATLQILLFAIVAAMVRIRAPGAKTFLRVIYARFGAKAHIVYVVFGLATKVLVTSLLMTGGAAVTRALVKDCPAVLVSVLIALTVACYTLIGGMGAMFYVSYCCSGIILAIVLYFVTHIFYMTSLNSFGLGSAERLYSLISCLNTREKYGNIDNSYMTFGSQSGLMFGVVNIVMEFGAVFLDQNYWQIAVAAKPRQVVYGYLMGGIVWFAVPLGMGTCMGIAYQALCAQAGRPLLTEEEVDQGLVAAIVAQNVFGSQGAFLLLVAVILAVVSTASSEVMTVTSIAVHDIYEIYLKPFRRGHDPKRCILCGKAKGRMANPIDKCQCTNKTVCKDCHQDDKARGQPKIAVKPSFQCQTHGEYRQYMEIMSGLNSWGLMIYSFALIPLTIILDVLGIHLGWLFTFMGIIISSAVIPVSLSVCWTRLTSEGMIAGALGGFISALSVWLGLVARQPNGLGASTFYRNSGDDSIMCAGNAVALLGGGAICVVVSYMTKPAIDIHETWMLTYDIDNPLHPWAQMYQKDLGLADNNKLDNRPSFQSVYTAFKKTSWWAIGLSVLLTAVTVVIWPAAMLAEGVFTLPVFANYLNMVMAWVTYAVVYIILAPLLEEGWAAYKAYNLRQKIQDNNQLALANLAPPTYATETEEAPQSLH